MYLELNISMEEKFNTDLISDLAYNLADQVTKQLFAGEVA